MTESMQGVSFALTSENFQRDPAATFTELRERCPVHFSEAPSPFYTLSLDHDVVAALRDEQLWSSAFGPGLAFSEPGSGVLVSSDPPAHTAERLAISRAFRPSVLEAMEDDIRNVVDALVASFEHRGHGDLISDLAMPLPLTVMCWMLGLPTADIDRFRSWVLPMAEAVALQGGRDANETVVTAYREYYAYFGPHVAARASAIDDGAEVADDLLTRLLTAERDGARLSHRQVVGFCQFLLVAGSATTTLLIGNVIDRLLRHPEQLAAVRRERQLVANAVEESLRIDSPVHGLYRTPTCPVTLHGTEIPEGHKTLLLFGSANRDPNAWADPDAFDVTRDLKDLRKRHTAFGVGVHYCLGAPLARLEAIAAVDAVLDRLPGLHRGGEPSPVAAPVLNGYEHLPVRWEVRDATAAQG
jgi:cytochrome P450